MALPARAQRGVLMRDAVMMLRMRRSHYPFFVSYQGDERQGARKREPPLSLTHPRSPHGETQQSLPVLSLCCAARPCAADAAGWATHPTNILARVVCDGL